MRLQTAAHVYDLACGSRSCSLEHSPIQFGDLLTIRVDKKIAYVSRANSTANEERKFEILDMRSIEDDRRIPQHSTDSPPDPDDGPWPTPPPAVPKARSASTIPQS